MADRYWVGGSGTWDSVTTTNWSATSGGGGGASAPTSADNAIFDSASDLSTAFTVTIGADAVCLDLTATPDIGMVLAWSATSFLDIYGSLAINNTNVSTTVVAGGQLRFRATTTGKTVLTSGVNLNGIILIFTGTGGAWTLSDALTCTGGSVNVQNGSFYTGSFNITANIFAITGTSSRYVNLEAATITLSSTTAPWDASTTTNLSFTQGTSTIVLTGSAPTFAGGGLTYYTVNFTSTSYSTSIITGQNTFGWLSFASPASDGFRYVTIAANQTVTRTLTLGTTNTPVRRMLLQSATAGVPRTVTVDTIAALNDVDFRDIVAAGNSATTQWTGNRLGDWAGNSNIQFATPKTVYWSAPAGGNWTSTAWATTAGGVPAVNNFPLGQDTAVFTNVGLNSGATVTMTAGYAAGTYDMSARSIPMTWSNLGSPNSTIIVKDFTLSSSVTMLGTQNLRFIGQGYVQTFTSAGVSIPNQITIDAANGGIVRLSGSLTNTVINPIILSNGTFDANDYNVTAYQFSSSTTAVRTIAFGSGQWTLTSNNQSLFNIADSSNLTITGTPIITGSYAGSVGTRSVQFGNVGGGNQARSIGVRITAGTDTFVTNSSYIRSFDLTGFAGTLTTANPRFYGDVTIPAGLTSTASTGTIYFIGSAPQTVTCGTTLDTTAAVQNSTTVTLGSAFAIGSTRTLFINGSFNAANYNVTAGLFAPSGSTVRTITMGTGTWTATGTGAVWDQSVATNLTLISAGSTILLSDTSTTARTFSGGSQTYNNLIIGGATGSSTTTITGTNTFTGTFSSTKTVAHTIVFPNVTTTIRQWGVRGSSGNVVTLTRTGASGTFTLSTPASSVINTDYLDISNSTVSQTNTWYAGANTTNSGGNTNWLFTYAPGRYWVGGAGNWDTSTTTNWSTSPGGVGGASVPTTTDDVWFDQSGTYTVTTAGALTCRDITVSVGTVTFNPNVSATYNVSGSMFLSATTTWNGGGATTFSSTTTGKTINTNGVSITGGTVLSGVGGSWTLASTFNATGNTFTVTNGSFDSASNPMNVNSLNSSISTVRSISLGSSTLTLSGQTPVNFLTSTNLTLNAGTSQINCTSGLITIYPGGLTLYNLSTTSTTTTLIQLLAGTFNNLTIAGRTSVGITPVYLYGNLTVNGTLTLGTGTAAAYRTFLRSDTFGTQRTLTVNAVAALTDIDFKDIVVAGAAGTWSGTRLGNCGNNSNITFPAAKTVYYAQTGSNSWGTTGSGSWSATSGGAADATQFPLAQDTAVFPAATYPASGSTTTINSGYNIGTIDMSLRTSNTMTLSSGSTPLIYGNIITGSGITYANNGTFLIVGIGTQTITSAGKTFTQSITIEKSAGTLQILDALTTSLTTTFTSGTLDLNGYSYTTSTWSSDSTIARTLAFNNGSITLTGSSSVIWSMNTGSSMTVTGTSVINCTYSGGTGTRSIYNRNTSGISFNITAGTDLVYISGGTFLYQDLNFTGFSGTLVAAASNWSMTGNLTISTGMTVQASSFGASFTRTSGTQLITTNGKVLDFPITFSGAGGTSQLQDALTLGSTRTLAIQAGTFDSNNKNVTAGSFSITGSTARTITMGTSTWTASGTGTVWDATTTTNLTLNSQASTILLSDTSTTARTFIGGGATYANFTIGGATGVSTTTITGTNTFSGWFSSTKTVAHTIVFPNVITTVGRWGVKGTSGNVVTLSRTGASGTFSLSTPYSSVVNTDYLSISNGTASNSNTWYMGPNSTDGGGNTSFLFTYAPGRYWVGGSGNWDNSTTTNWSTAPGGSGGASVPTATDDVWFDAGSDAGGIFTVTLNATPACRDFSVSQNTALDFAMTMGIGTATSMVIYGSLNLPATNLTRTYTGVMYFNATSGTWTVSTGITMSNTLAFGNPGTGGTWTLFNTLNNNAGVVQHYGGVLNTNGYAVTTLNITANGSVAKTFNFSSSTVTLVNSTTLVNFTGANTTLIPGTSNIVCTNSDGQFLGGGLTFYNLSFTSTSSGTVTLDGANTFNNLTISAPASGTIKIFNINTSFAVTGTLSVNASSNATRRSMLRYGGSVGTNITITAAAISLSDVDFRNITAAGAVGTWTGTRLGDCGGNSGITFPATKTVYWNLVAGGNWNATAWALTSGGTPDANNFPLPQDTAIIGNTGLTAGNTITMSVAYQTGTVDFTTRTLAATLAHTAYATYYGDFLLSSAVTMTSSATNFNISPQNKTVSYRTAGNSFAPLISIAAPGSTLNMLDAWTTTSAGGFTLTSGALVLNNYTLTSTVFVASSAQTRSIAFGTGKIVLTGNGATVLNVQTATGLTYTGTPLIQSTYAGSTGTRVFQFGSTAGATESNALSVSVTAGSDSVSLSGSFLNVDYTGFTGTENAFARFMYGNMTFGTGMTVTSATSVITFTATSGTKTITSNGVTVDRPIDFTGVGGSWRLGDSLTMGSTRAMQLFAGTLDAVTYNVTALSFASVGSSTRVLNMGSGTWSMTGTGVIWNIGGSSLTINAQASTILLTDTSTTARTFNGFGYTYNNFIIGGTSGTSTTTIQGSNTFTGEFGSTKTVAHTVEFPVGTTSIARWTIKGSSGNVVTVARTGASGVFTLSTTGARIINTDYISISNSTVSQTSTWYAGANSTNGGGNTNWLFTYAPGRYWVGGSGTWDASTTTNWATSPGGTSGAAAPTTTDDVWFDAGSDTGTGFTVTVSTGAVGRDVQMGQDTALDQVLTLAGTATWDIYGSLVLPPASSFVRTYTGIINFNAITTGHVIVTNGNGFNTASNFNFAGVGGGWSLGGSIVAGGTGLILSNGTFDFAGYAATFTLLGSGGSTAARTFLLRSSAITLANSSTPLSLGSVTGLTWTPATSTIYCSGATPTFAGLGLTFYNVVFTSTASGNLTITGANTFNDLTFTSRAANGFKRIVFSANMTISGTLTFGVANTPVRRMTVTYTAGNVGTPYTLTTAAIAPLNDVDFRDAIAAGAAGTWSGTRLGNIGGCTNINFATPKTVYWNQAAGGNWSDTAWALTSGGTPDVNNFPLVQDTVVIDDTGLTAGNTITFDYSWWIGVVSAGSRTTAFTLAIGSQAIAQYGNFTLPSVATVTASSTGVIYLGTINSSTSVITTNGVSIPAEIDFYGNYGATIQLNGNLTSTNTNASVLAYGTLDLNEYTYTCTAFTSSGTNTRAIDFGITGKIVLTGSNSTIWNTSTVTNLTVTGTPTVEANYSGSTGTRTFVHGVSGGTEARTFNFGITAGSDIVDMPSAVRTLSFGSSSVSYDISGQTLYGGLQLSPTMILTGGASNLTFAASSSTYSIDSGGLTIDAPVTFINVGGTWELRNSFVLASGRSFTLTGGTFDAKTYDVSCDTFISSGSNTRALRLGTAQWSINASGATAWNISSTTGFTLFKDTGTISMTSSSPKTFVGGGLVYYNLNQGGSGTLTITGSNTFQNITNSVSPTTVTFTASTTTTVYGFRLTGTAGNLVTVNSTSVSQFTLTGASPTTGLSSRQTVDYLDISYSTVTNGRWYAGANSVDTISNTGWTAFSAPPVRYWVGGSGTWTNTSTTNWALTSGGASGASAPDWFTDVVFDSASGSGNYTVTLASSVAGTANLVSTSSVNVATVTSGTVTINSYIGLGSATGPTTYGYLAAFGTGSGGVGTYTGYFSGTLTTVFALYAYPTCANLTISAPSGGTAVTIAGAMTLAIAGSLVVASGALTRTFTGSVFFLTNNGGKTIGFNSFANSINFVGVSGEWTLQNDINIGSGTINHQNGSLITAGYTVTASSLTTSYTSSRSLSLGASVLNLTTTGTAFNASSTTNLTFLCGTSNIVLSAAAPGINPGSGVTFYDVTYTSTSFTSSTWNITGPATYNNLTFSTLTSAGGISRAVISGNQTINGTLTVPGSSGIYRWSLQSGSFLTQYTISAGAISLTDVNFRDIAAAGTSLGATGSWTGTRLGDGGGCANITFPTGKNVYWVSAAGAATYTANVWSDVSGGTGNNIYTPLPQDTMIIDNTGLGSGNTITVNSTADYGALDMSSRTLPMAFTGASTNTTFYGNVTLTTALTGTAFSSGGIVFVTRTANQVISLTSAGKTWGGYPGFAPRTDGTVRLLDSQIFNQGTNMSWTTGTLDLNNYDLTISSYSGSSNNTRTLAFGTGNIYVTASSGVVWTATSVGSTTITGNPRVVFTYSGSVGTRAIRWGSSGGTEFNSLNIYISSGTDIVTFWDTSTYRYRDIDFTGFAGTFNNAGLSAGTMYGNLTLVPAMTVTPSTNPVTFFSSAGNKTITSAGKSITSSDMSFTSGDWIFTDTFSSAGNITLTLGNVQANSNITVASFASNSASARTVNLGPGTWTIGNTWSVVGTNLTVNPGTSNIDMASANAKTFAGGNETYYNLRTTGLGNLTITGNNTFNNLVNTVQPTAVILTSGTTTTLSNFGLQGNAGNLVTLTSTSTTAHTLYLPGTTRVSADYLNISYSNATG